MAYVCTTGRRGREIMLQWHKHGWRFVTCVTADLIHPSFPRTEQMTIFTKGDPDDRKGERVGWTN